MQCSHYGGPYGLSWTWRRTPAYTSSASRRPSSRASTLSARPSRPRAGASSFQLDAQGKPDGGVAIVTDWPVELVTILLAETFPHRIMAVKAHRPRQRHLLVINGYLPANDDPLNQRLCSSLVEWATSTGEDCIIMADWNREPKQQPLGNLLASGTIYALDPDPFFNDLGTHRMENGVYTGKTIDYGISSVGIGSASRLQRLGPADHDLVAYDIPLKGTRRGWRWQPRRLLDGEAIFDWNKLWADVADEFTVLLDAGNTEAAWKLLSATAEDALAQDSRRARPRGEPGRPLLVKPPTVQTLKERKLRRAARRLMEVLRKERAGILTVDEKGKLLRCLHHIVAAYPDLTDLLHYHDDELLAFLQHAAEGGDAGQPGPTGRLEGAGENGHPTALALGQGLAGGASHRYGQLCCGPGPSSQGGAGNQGVGQPVTGVLLILDFVSLSLSSGFLLRQLLQFVFAVTFCIGGPRRRRARRPVVTTGLVDFGVHFLSSSLLPLPIYGTRCWRGPPFRRPGLRCASASFQRRREANDRSPLLPWHGGLVLLQWFNS